MKREYDFSKGERGKFFRRGANIRFPVYLDASLQRYLAEKAASKGISVSDMVNDVLKREIAIVEALK